MKNIQDHRALGQWGEQRAADYLKAQGYRIVERNYRCRIGEIDLIAYKEGVLSFVEVKTRRSLNYGLPCEAIGIRKQRRMARIVEFFSAAHPCWDGVEWSVDIVEMLVLEGRCHIRHTKQALL